MYVGIDHSTTGIKVTCLGDDHPEHAFRIDRREVDDGSVLAALAEHVDPDDVTLATMTYSWANGISEIVDIERPSNRGVKDYTGLGYETGAGARTYDQLRSSSIPTVVLPGVHDGLDTLHPYFKHYSTLAGADKVADMRFALERARKAGADGNVIWACASSSCMAGLISEGNFAGSSTGWDPFTAGRTRRPSERARTTGSRTCSCSAGSSRVAGRRWPTCTTSPTPKSSRRCTGRRCRTSTRCIRSLTFSGHDRWTPSSSPDV
ncbi:hypothetical protein VB779_18325 [Haloarculaceae archaeon H-GB11]|nr:hypothetical protein [Haloarculaceae archaeon H-GB11]